jgi:hypothetical protein
MTATCRSLPLQCPYPTLASSLTLHHFVHVAHKHFGGFLVEVLTFVFVYFPLAYLTLLREDRNDIDRYLRGFANRGRNLQRSISKLFGVP